MSDQQQKPQPAPQAATDEAVGVDAEALRRLTPMESTTMKDVMGETLPTRITKISGGHEPLPIIPQTIEDALRIGKALVLSGMVPKALTTGAKSQEEVAARVMVVLMKGLELRRPPMWSMANIYVVNNRPSVWGDGALDLIMTHPDFVDIRETLTGDQKTPAWTARCEIDRRQRDGSIKTTVQEFSWANATGANLTNKGPWKLYPQRMLKMRARAWAIRDSFADALAGLGIKEEQDDIPVATTTDTSFLTDSLPSADATPGVGTAAKLIQAIDEAQSDVAVDAVVFNAGADLQAMKAVDNNAYETVMAAAASKKLALAPEVAKEPEKPA